MNTSDFKQIIVAVGFGRESQVAGLETPSYWDDRTFDVPQSGTFLVSGYGDGGLIDTIRLCISDYKHETLLETLTLSDPSKDHVGKLSAELLRIERESLRCDNDQAAAKHLTTSYSQLTPLSREVDAVLGSRFTERNVVLNGPTEYYLSPRSSILNRYIVSRLIALEKVAVQVGSIKSGGHQRVGEELIVLFANGQQEKFRGVIIRHGAKSALAEGFPEIAAKGEVIRSRNLLDQTRWPLYEPEFYKKTTLPTVPEATAISPKAALIPSSLDVLFDVYKPSFLQFYHSRDIDSRISPLVKKYHLWIHGPSGTGKTTSLVKHLAEIDGYNYINVAASVSSSIPLLLQDIYGELSDRLGQSDARRDHEEPLPATIKKIAHLALSIEKPLIIHIDELPVSEAQEPLLAQAIAGLLLCLDTPREKVMFAISSLTDPSKHLDAPQIKVKERLAIVEFKRWSPMEIDGLVGRCISELQLDISSKEVVEAANGLPRLAKTILRKAHLYPDRRLAELILEAREEVGE